MKKSFNTEGVCNPKLHYMVDIEDSLAEIKALVDKNKYFTVNKARQYGKTTTLKQLSQKLSPGYLVFFISFEGVGETMYRNDTNFCREFCGLLSDTIDYGETTGVPDEIYRLLLNYSNEEKETTFRELSNIISKMCRLSKPIVLIIDEVDQASGSSIFLSFLGMLRNKYLQREERPTFHSVILSGVHDIKNLKLKMRGEEHQYNSPWNIAADFTVDMSFSETGIEKMLAEYETDYRTGMNEKQMAAFIYHDTSGYPFLVSRLCKIIDERVVGSREYPDRKDAWTKAGFLEAERILLAEKNPLFESLINKLYDRPELKEMLDGLLFTGKDIVYNPDNRAVDTALMYGFIKNCSGVVVLANRIFEMRLYNMFLSAPELQNTDIYRDSLSNKNQFIINGHLNMTLILEKFVIHFSDLYGDKGEKFLEDDGRKFFLLYLKPIINGTGNYYIESRTRDLRRTDVIVDYSGEQFIIEMKIWHGNEYNRRGEQQLAGYLDDYHQNKGYMLSFNFSKNKQIGVREIKIGDKRIVEAVV